MLQPLTYHTRVRDHFKSQSKTWDFFAQQQNRDAYLAEFKNELLKNTYKFSPETDTALYDKVHQAKTALGLEHLPVTVYQAQYSEEVNASIIFLGNEAHLVFSGRITQLLDDAELLAVIAHELTHVKLYTLLDGDLEVADRIITSIANHGESDPVYYETARRFRLYTEIFCDRGAYLVLRQTAPVITSLVKVATGLDKVHAENYIRQAEEIFAAAAEKSNTHSHPENYIRARAIHLWATEGEKAAMEISRMMEGDSEIDRLDLFAQEELTALTRNFLQLFLKPKWFQSGPIIGHARNFFNDFKTDEDLVLKSETTERIGLAHTSIKEYLCWLLYDFAVLDPSLEEVPFGRAFQFAEDTGLKETFNQIVIREMKLSQKRLETFRIKSLNAFHAVPEGAAEQINED